MLNLTLSATRLSHDNSKNIKSHGVIENLIRLFIEVMIKVIIDLSDRQSLIYIYSLYTHPVFPSPLALAIFKCPPLWIDGSAVY